MVSPKASALHYGWIILGAGIFGSFMTLPGQAAGVSVFFDPITTDLGISRTSASIAYAAGTLTGILPAPVIGRWIDRRGPRLTATIIAGGLALACALMATVQSAATLLIGSQQAINAAGYAQYFGRDHLGAIRGASFVFGIAGAAFGPLPFAASVDWTGSYAAVLAGCCALCIVCGAGAFAVRRPSAEATTNREVGATP